MLIDIVTFPDTNGVVVNGSSYKSNGIMSTDFEAQNREYLHRLNDIQVHMAIHHL